MHRRQFLATTIMTPMLLRGTAAAAPALHVPAEWHPHACTYMVWPSATVWEDDLAEVRRELLTLAAAIATAEPVRLIVPPRLVEDVTRRLPANVEIVPLACNDLWARDTLPVFGIRGGRPVGVATRFNVWGGKFGGYEDDRSLAERLARQADIDSETADLVTEGGAIEYDGAGTLLTTETAVLNSNRNPGMNKAEATERLKRAFGAAAVVWLPGDDGDAITDGHIDGLARFAGKPGIVFAERGTDRSSPEHAMLEENFRALQHARDASGRPLEVIPLHQPAPSRDTGPDDNRSYSNYYVANGAVFVHAFGDRRADAAAAEAIGRGFPGRRVVQLRLDTLCSGGGGIHCSTQQLPLAAAHRPG